MAFESLTDKLQNVFKKLRSKGRLTEEDVKVKSTINSSHDVYNYNTVTIYGGVFYTNQSISEPVYHLQLELPQRFLSPYNRINK